MSEPAFFSLFRRTRGRKSSRRGFSSHAAAYVEQLEPRRMLAPITPVVAVTQYDGAVEAVSSFTGTQSLQVATTAGFAASGDLFVQTTTGVATIKYNGTDATHFLNCLLQGDTYSVGAGDAAGHVDPAMPAVFQATHQTFTITVPNQANVSVNLSYSMYWSSLGGDGDNANFYALAPGDKYENFQGNLTNNQALPAFSVTASNPPTTITLPYVPINAARIYFFTGGASPLSASYNSSVWGVNAPDPSGYLGIYDYFEVNLNANGVNNTTSGSNTQYLPEFTVDTTQVDQFGIPMTLSGMSNNGKTTEQLTAGVTDSQAVARDAIIKRFSEIHSNDAYSELVLPASSQSLGLNRRILNPGKLAMTSSDPLAHVFDSVINTLFQESGLQLSANGTTYTGNTKTVTIGPDSYTVLEFTPVGGGTALDVYSPIYSAAPSWIVNKTETAGQMVFGNDGVFDDSGVQPTSGDRKALASLENQIVAAINRGVALLPTSEWLDTGRFYTTGPYNEYAQFFHQQSISGAPIMIDGHAYAFPYDDQGGNSTTLTLLDQNSATVTLGPWTATGPSGNNDGFLAAVYQNVLHRGVDPSGHAYWLGLLAAGQSRDQVSLGIVNSVEAHTDLIKGFYTSLLSRSADAQGLNQYLQLFAEGWSAPQIKSLFYGSQEYLQTHGGTNSDFANSLYHNELNGAADSQLQAAVNQALAQGQSRTYVATLVVGSSQGEQAQVNNYYLDYLLRPADPAGMTFWTSVLAQSDHDSLVAAGVLGSTEYFNRT